MTTIFHHVVKLLLCLGVLTNLLASSSSLPIHDEGSDGSEIHISNHRSLQDLFTIEFKSSSGPATYTNVIAQGGNAGLGVQEPTMVSNKLKLLGHARCEWLVGCTAI